MRSALSRRRKLRRIWKVDGMKVDVRLEFLAQLNEALRIRHGVCKAGVLTPTNSPNPRAPRDDEKLPTSHEFIRGSFVANQRAAEADDGRISSHESQFFEAFALNAVSEDCSMSFRVPILDRTTTCPDRSGPEYPDAVVMKDGAKRLHIVRVPSPLPARKHGRDLFTVCGPIRRRRRLAHRWLRKEQSRAKCGDK
jgi:hypothetical protein